MFHFLGPLESPNDLSGGEGGRGPNIRGCAIETQLAA